MVCVISGIAWIPGGMWGAHDILNVARYPGKEFG